MATGLLLAWQLAQLQVPEPPLPADDLVWTAPASCPDREALLAGIERRRGRLLTPGQVRLRARTSVLGPRRYRLELELNLGERREMRVLTASTCAALVDAAALVIALAIDAGIPALGRRAAPCEFFLPAVIGPPRSGVEISGAHPHALH